LLWLVPYALLYPHLAHHLGRRFRHEQSERLPQILLFIDALHVGAGCTLLGFSVVPSLMFLLTLGFSALISGGLRYLAVALLAAVSGTLMTGVLINPEFKNGVPTLVALVSAL